MIGLTLGGEQTRFCVLDAVGQILEEGLTQSSETALRRLLASMPPSAIAVEYSPEAPDLLPAVQGLGHVVFLSGPAPAPLAAALQPRVQAVVQQSERVTGAAATVAWRHLAPGSDGVALQLLFGVDSDGQVDGGWYFVGPISADVDLKSLRGLAGPQRSGASAREQARRLQQLLRLGDMSLTACAERAAA